LTVSPWGAIHLVVALLGHALVRANQLRLASPRWGGSQVERGMGSDSRPTTLLVVQNNRRTHSICATGQFCVAGPQGGLGGTKGVPVLEPLACSSPVHAVDKHELVLHLVSRGEKLH